jgi:hypothetical protein
MSEELLSVRAVLGDGPFAEIGKPTLAVQHPKGDVVALAGMLGPLQWAGNDLHGPRGASHWHRLGLYRTRDLACLAVVTLADPVHAAAFHPVLPLVAVASGSYDGGWFYEGRLTLVDLETGRQTSVLDESREVRDLRWVDEETLELVLSPRDEDEEATIGARDLRAVVRRPDWRALAGRSLQVAGLDLVPVPGPPRGADAGPAAREALDGLTGRHRTWSPRRQVWAVGRTGTGQVLCALEGVAIQAWTDAGELAWMVPIDGLGTQLVLAPDQRSALVNAQTGRSSMERSTTFMRVDLASGTTASTLELAFPAVATARSDGWWAIRDARHDADAGTRLMAPDGRAAGRVDLRRYDLFNHYLAIRHAPELLFLHGMGSEPHQDKWVVAVDPAHERSRPEVRRLFPLEWDAARSGHLYGGPGVYLRDGRGPAIVHGCQVHNPSGLLPGNSIVVRRAFPEGQVAWTFRADFPLSGIDVLGDLVVAAFTSGELVVLRAEDGELIGRQRLTIGGQPVVPLSLASSGGRLVIGTLDGRVLCGDLAIARPGRATGEAG